VGVACAATVVVVAAVVVVAGVGVGGVGGGGVVGGVVLFGVGGGLGGSCLLLLFHPLHFAELGTSVLEPHLHRTATTTTTTIKTSCCSCTAPRLLNTLWVTQYITTLTNVLLSKRYTVFVTCPLASLRSVSVCVIIVYVCAFESWLSSYMCVCKTVCISLGPSWVSSAK